MFKIASLRKNRNVRKNRKLRIEVLENRALFATDLTFNQPAVNIAPEEQLFVELVNQARANPAQAANGFGVDLNENLALGTISASPKQPLAVNSALADAAIQHSMDMLAQNYFNHSSPTGSTPSSRAASSGYSGSVGENISVRSISGDSLDATIAKSHEQLFQSAGHRANLLNGSYNEIGIGVEQGSFQFQSGRLDSTMTTQLFGISRSSSALTGVAYTDQVAPDNFYSLGEGMSGIRIEAVAQDGKVYATTTGSSGGYALNLPNGSYRVRAVDNMNLAFADMGIAVIAGQNVKMDVTAADFKNTAPTPPSTTPPKNSDGDSSSSIRNVLNRYDINGDNQVTPIDLLGIINFINGSQNVYPGSMDINVDGIVDESDLRLLTDVLNSTPTQEASTDSQNRAGNSSASITEATQSVIVSQPATLTESTVVARQLNDAVDASKKALSTLLNVSPSEFIVELSQVTEWGDSRFGLPGIASMMITPGYQVILRHQTALYEYRGANNGAPVLAYYTSTNDWKDSEDDFLCPWEDWTLDYEEALDNALTAISRELNAN